MVTEHEKTRSDKTKEAKKPVPKTERRHLASYSNWNYKHGLFDLKGLTCRVVEVELPATMPILEGIQTQTLALEVEVGI